MKRIRLTALLAAGIITFGSISTIAQNINKPKPKTFFTPQPTSFIDNQKEHPVKIKEYVFNNDSNKYVLDEVQTYELNEQGLRKSKYSTDAPYWSYLFQEYEYDEKGRCTAVIDGRIKKDETNKEYEYKHEYAYDDVCEDFKINNCYYSYNPLNSSWILISDTHIEITRDEQKRTLKSEKLNAETDFLYNIVESTYGDSSSPEKVIISTYKEEDGSIMFKSEYTDIEWYACDNQIIDQWQLAEIVRGNDVINRINKVYVRDSNQWSDIKMVKYYKYDDKGRITSYKSHNIDKEGNPSVTYDLEEYEYTDDYGSYVKTTYDTNDWNGDNIISETELNKEYTYTYKYDENKNVILYEKHYYWYDDATLTESYKCDIEYDEEGRVAQILEKQKSDSDAPEVSTKTVYEYNSVPTGIKNVENKTADIMVYDSMITLGTNAECAYRICNAEGKLVMNGTTTEGRISTESLPSGFYIVSVNNTYGNSSAKFMK